MSFKDKFIKRPTILQSILNKDWLHTTLVKSTDFVGFIGGIVFLISALFQLIVSKVNKATRKDEKPIYSDHIQMQQIGVIN